LFTIPFVPQGYGAESKELFRGKGCKVCKSTSYKGRIGIFELLVINEDIRKLIVNRSSSEAIKKKAQEGGMKTLRDDGVAKIYEGITTIEEVYRVTAKD